jgi:hypothetical protein
VHGRIVIAATSLAPDVTSIVHMAAPMQARASVLLRAIQITRHKQPGIKPLYMLRLQEIMVLPPAKSPAKGTKGLSLRIKVNHFLVTCTAKDAMQYNLEFEPIRRAPTEDAAAPSSLPKRPQKDPPKDVLRLRIIFADIDVVASAHSPFISPYVCCPLC